MRDYVTDDPESFSLKFTISNSNRDEIHVNKQVNINNRIYMDKNDLFLVNLTKVVITPEQEAIVDANLTAFLSSPHDTYSIVSPTEDITNGPASIMPVLNFYHDIWSTSYELDKKFKINLDVEIVRPGDYWAVKSRKLVLELIDRSILSKSIDSSSSSASSSSAIDKDSEGNRKILADFDDDIYLKSFEANRTFQVKLKKCEFYIN